MQHEIFLSVSCHRPNPLQIFLCLIGFYEIPNNALSACFSPFVWSTSMEYRATTALPVYIACQCQTRVATPPLCHVGVSRTLKLEPVSITRYGSCLPRTGRRSCIQEVLELRTKVTTTCREGSDTNSRQCTFESFQIPVLFDGRHSYLTSATASAVGSLYR